ncbi:MAG: polyprenol monophosphomannose synthase [Propionibacteriaceae bacterium]|jgi:dolichol-phosphate mannosyltransferase|nr:polyprenol monophosphomannose synthase [Propionibacteriaceae bacterium]
MKVLVAIPTYNEVENVPLITARLRKEVPEADILIADDNSPDGTGKVADELAAQDGHIQVLHRPGKAGLGAAYVAAFHWGLERGYEVIVEFDADGSHRPEDLPKLLEALSAGADVAKGSRWVKGGEVVNWPLSREVLSRGGNLWTRLWLGIPVKDATGGFAAWRATTLRGIDLTSVEAAGYGFQVDLAWKAYRAGFRIVEVPITFEERQLGASKMSGNIVAEALVLTTKWGLKYRLGQAGELGRKAAAQTASGARWLADRLDEVARKP